MTPFFPIQDIWGSFYITYIDMITTTIGKLGSTFLKLLHDKTRKAIRKTYLFYPQNRYWQKLYRIPLPKIPHK